ncbi:MAG TPA: hypothetical protein VHE61_18765 [Opitutaceae bacterium]|nr:hypothetical protein [Opitutaceae bacterium]
MKAKLVLALVLSFVLAGCSTVQSRIAQHRTAYDAWPPGVQQRVSAGQIGIGFTMEQVTVALGQPDSAFARTTQKGTVTIWGYHSHRPRIGIGIGMASFGRGSAVGGGVSTSTGGYRGERMRVIFDATGRVSQIEQAGR